MPNENEWEVKTWRAGEVITAGKMNRIENQVEALTNEVEGARTYGEGAANSLGARIDNMIIYSQNQPTTPDNELWIKSQSTDIQVPTYSDFENLKYDIANEFNTSNSYEVGDYVWYNNILYQFILAHPAGSWNGTQVEEVVLGNTIKNSIDNSNEIKNSFIDNIEKITGCVPLVFTPGRYIAPSSQIAPGDLISYATNPTTSNNKYVCAKCACVPGDIFTVHVYGYAGNNRACFFCDSNMKVVSGGYAGSNEELNKYLVAPEGAAYVVFTNALANLPTGYYAYKGVSLHTKNLINSNIPASIEEITGNLFGTWTIGYYMTPTDGQDVTYSTAKTLVSTLMSVQPGDKITVNATGSSGNSRLYVFITSDWKAIGRCDTYLTGRRVITAPDNAAYVAINNFLTDQPDNYYAIKNELLYPKVNDFLSSDYEFRYRGTLNEESDLNLIEKTGTYQWTSSNKPQYNCPFTHEGGGRLIQYGSGSRGLQIVFPMYSDCTTFYWRGRTSVDWYPWKEVAEKNDVDALVNTVSTSIYNTIKAITGNEIINNWNDGYWYNTSESSLNVESPISRDASTCMYVACQEGEYFTLTGTGGTTSHRLFVFVDSEGTILPEPKGKSNEVAVNKIIKAPPDAAYLAITIVDKNSEHVLYKGQYINSRLDALEDNNSDLYIPDYYYQDNYLKNKIDSIIERNLYIKGDNFIFITDYHAHKNAGHSPKIINYIYEQTGISKLFCGGDIGTSTGISGIKTNAKAMKTLNNSIPNFYACTGNHEWKVSDENNNMPSSKYNSVYNYYINQMESKCLNMSDFGDYWIDSKGQKIRYFFINQNISALITDPSLKWFMSELLNVPAGYGIVVIMHSAYHNKTYNDLPARAYFGYLGGSLGIKNINIRRITQILNAIKTGTTVKYALLPYDNTKDIKDNYTPYTTSDNHGNYNPILSTFADGTNTGNYTDIVTFDGSAVNTGVYPIAILSGHKHEDGGCDPATATSIDDMIDTTRIYLLNGEWYWYNTIPGNENYEQWTPLTINANNSPEAVGLSPTEILPPILTILTTTDCYKLKHTVDDHGYILDSTERELGTITEQAFDIVQIDTIERKVHLTRIGSGDDRTFSY